jgi:hypothetical protein
MIDRACVASYPSDAARRTMTSMQLRRPAGWALAALCVAGCAAHDPPASTPTDAAAATDLTDGPPADLGVPADLAPIPSDLSPAVMDLASSDLATPLVWSAPMETGGGFLAGFALARDDVYVVGNGNVVVHSHGDDQWLPVDTGVTGGKYFTVWGDRATGDLWIGGGGLIIMHTTDGVHWAQETVTASPWSGAIALWGSSADDVYASGYGTPVVVHRGNDGTWTPVPFVGPPPAYEIYGIGGSSATDVFFVGGTVVYRGSPAGLTLDFYNPLGQTQHYNVLALSPTNLYMTSKFGIYHSKGDGQWDMEPNQPTYADFLSIWASGPTDIYVTRVGAYHSTGDGTWTPFDVGIHGYGDPMAVFGYDADDLYLVSDDGIVHGHR